MSLLHRSIEQIRRAQALSGNGPASRLLKAQADSALAGPVWPSPGLRRLLTGAALLIFSGLICLGAIYGLRQYKAITHPEGPAQSRTEPGESRPTSPTSLPPQPAASVDPPLLPASTASMPLPEHRLLRRDQRLWCNPTKWNITFRNRRGETRKFSIGSARCALPCKAEMCRLRARLWPSCCAR